MLGTLDPGNGIALDAIVRYDVVIDGIECRDSAAIPAAFQPFARRVHNSDALAHLLTRGQQLAAIFESEGPTFRDQAFEAYKANRTETPPDLLEQIPWIRKTLEAMRIPVLEYPGFEADDVIGTLSRRAENSGAG